MRLSPVFLIVAALVGMPAIVVACDLCTPQGPPLSNEKAAARIVLFGHVTDHTLGAGGTGSSEFAIEHIVKNDEALKNQKRVTLNKFLPKNAKVKHLVFMDVTGGKLDDLICIQFGTDRVVKYLQKAEAYDPKADLKSRVERLRYYFDYLHDEEPEIAVDAFKEFAISSNEDVGHAAKSFDPKKLRVWLEDKKTPAVRLSLYAYLLGACGKDEDAEKLRGYIEKRDDRMNGALDGLLAGYISLNPNEGWKMAIQILGDDKRQFTERLTVLRMLRFYRGFQPKESAPHILAACKVLIESPDLLDLVVEQMRTWKLWDHADKVLAKYQKKDPPITKRAIVRYALCCPLDSAKNFIQELEKDPKDKKLVEEVAEGLKRSP